MTQRLSEFEAGLLIEDLSTLFVSKHRHHQAHLQEFTAIVLQIRYYQCYFGWQFKSVDPNFQVESM